MMSKARKNGFKKHKTGFRVILCSKALEANTCTDIENEASGSDQDVKKFNLPLSTALKSGIVLNIMSGNELQNGIKAGEQVYYSIQINFHNLS